MFIYFQNISFSGILHNFQAVTTCKEELAVLRQEDEYSMAAVLGMFQANSNTDA